MHRIWMKKAEKSFAGNGTSVTLKLKVNMLEGIKTGMVGRLTRETPGSGARPVKEANPTRQLR